MSMSLKAMFQNPPSAYRTAPLWVWNDEMTAGLIERQLHELKTHGFGGAFVHPRPGLITPYLSEQWFDLWSFALEEAEKLGLKLYIYDENSYPSGFAGGHVSAELPDCLAVSVQLKIVNHRSDWKEERASAWMANSKLVKALACEPIDGGYRLVRDVTLVPDRQWRDIAPFTLIAEFMPAETNTWLGGFAYADLLRPEVAERFLACTYEAYYERFGDKFGTTIPAIFTDEPAIPGSKIYSRETNHLPFSYWLAAEFYKLHGYSLVDHLPCLFMDIEGDMLAHPVVKVRYDYYSTIRALFVNNFIKPVSKWCEDHGICWTGHYMENYWPFAAAGMPSPAVMSYYEYMQWPAIDMLMAYMLRDRPADQLLLTIKEVQSAANQFDRTRVLCETYGAGGWDSTFEDYKRIGDWLMVHGVNFINQHYTAGTLVGARKRDHPQSFDWRQPWWDDYKDLGDYYGRLSCLLSQGKTVNRILVLHPTTTGFLTARAEEQGDLMTDKPITNPNMTAYMDMLQWLADEQWDYDLGDEFIMENHGRVKNGKLAVAARSYELVIVSGDMKNMKATTFSLIRQFMNEGGAVLSSSGMPGPYVDAIEAHASFEALAGHENWLTVSGYDHLNQELKKRLHCQLSNNEPWRAGVAHLCRILEDHSSVYFIVNHSGSYYRANIAIEGNRLERWDPWTGNVTLAHADPSPEGLLGYDLALEPNESIVLVVRTEVEREAVASSRTDPAVISNPVQLNDPATARLTLVPDRIWADGDNALVLDYCDVEADGCAWIDINAVAAGQQLYKLRGFAGNPWDNAIQYKRRLLDRNEFDSNSGFRASYSFVWGGSAVPERLWLAVERSEFYRLLVNGQEVQWSPGEQWLDHHISMADIRSQVRQGENKVTLIADRFDILLELEAIYLKGTFAVDSINGRWVVSNARRVVLGPWTTQGYPFYPGAFRYSSRFEVPVGTARVTIDAAGYVGTAASLYVNGQRIRLLGVGHERCADITPWVSEGWNEATVRVCGSFKNLLGPHHTAAKLRGRAWPGHWREAPVFGQPSADHYDFIDYGLNTGPTLAFERQ